MTNIVGYILIEGSKVVNRKQLIVSHIVLSVICNFRYITLCKNEEIHDYF